MLLVAIHIIAIGMLSAVVGTLAYRRGFQAGERRGRRAAQAIAESSPPPNA